MICLSHITSQWTSQSNSYLPVQAPLHHVSSKNFNTRMREDDRGVSEGNEKVLNEGKNFLNKKKKKRERPVQTETKIPLCIMAIMCLVEI